MIRPFVALMLDVPRRMARGKVLWIFVLLSAVMVALAGALGVRKTPDGGEYLTWFGQPGMPPGYLPPIQDEVQDFVMQLYGTLTLYVGVVSGLIVFADAVTNAFNPGAAELNVTKPVSRGAIVVARHAGAVLLATCFAGGVMGAGVGVAWLRTGAFAAAPLYVVPVSVLLFALLHAVGTVGSMLTEYAFFGVLTSFGAWFVSYGTDLLAKKLPSAGAMKVLDHMAKASGLAHRLFPRAADLRDLFDRLVSGSFGKPWREGGIEVGGGLYEVELLANCALWIVIALGISTVLVRRRDL